MKRSKSKTLPLLIMLLSGVFTCGAAAVPNRHLRNVSAYSLAQTGLADLQDLEAFIDNVMADEMKTDHIPGAVVSVVKDGKQVFGKGYGYSDLENVTPVDPERTLFRVGSISKLFVWTAVMQLAEQGELSLDADVNSYLDFRVPATYPQPITVKNLMSHTAGFEGSDQGLCKRRPEEMESLAQYVKTYIPARVFPPGKIEAYSNYGAALAAYIIERISGKSFSENVEINILSPLGMSRSTFRQPLPIDLAPDLANGYYFSEEKYVRAGFEYVVAYPVGALSSTGADMARFMLAHLQDGQLGSTRILAKNTAEQMHSQLFTHDPRITGMAYGFYENRINGQRLLCHGGGSLIFYSKLCLIPNQNLGIFVSTNAPGGANAREVLIRRFMDRYYPGASDPTPVPAPGLASRMAPYLGTYYQASSNFSTAEKLLRLERELSVSLDLKGNLVATSGNQAVTFVEVEPGLMRDPHDGNLELVLRTDENGQIYLLTPEPAPWIKTPWYGTSSFHGLLLGVGAILFTFTLVGWSLAALIRLGRPSSPPLLSRLAHWTCALFALLLVVILAGWISLLTTTDPAFGAQAVVFGLPPLYYVLYGMAYVLVGLGALMLVLTALAWARRLWGPAGRLHYTLLTLSGFSLLWALWYWNLL